MSPENFEKMSKAALIRELKKIQDAHCRSVADLEAADPKRAMYDLEIHQIELEMRNRELRESQQRLEDAQARYSEPYNFAPVGYCTLDPEGYIQEINLTASAMLETPRPGSMSSVRFEEIRWGDCPAGHTHARVTDGFRITVSMRLEPSYSCQNLQATKSSRCSCQSYSDCGRKCEDSEQESGLPLSVRIRQFTGIRSSRRAV